MKNILISCVVAYTMALSSCKKDDSTDPPNPSNQQVPQKYSVTTQCTTYKTDGTVLQVGTPFNYTMTMEQSGKPSFDLHFINFTGDSDTTVYAAKNSIVGSFIIPSQQFKTSNGSNLIIVGQGNQSGDSLNYSWSFYVSSTYKSHDCVCKSKKQ
jgi:hypothetical protein